VLADVEHWRQERDRDASREQQVPRATLAGIQKGLDRIARDVERLRRAVSEQIWTRRAEQ
jgi:hypothetical protein